MKKILALILSVVGLGACAQQNFENRDVAGFAALVADSAVTVLDVRTPEEFAQGHLARAVNINVFDSDFAERAAAALPQGRTVAVYCRSGKRSARAAQLLAAKGYTVVNLSGGILAWTEQKQPVTQ